MSGTPIQDILNGRLAPYVTGYPSPDGAWAVVTAANEIRMSHWIETGSLHDVAADRMVADLGGHLWSVDSVAWSADSRTVTIALRRYPGDAPGLSLRLDPAARTAEVVSDPAERVRLSGLSAWLERWYRGHGGRWK